MQISINAHLVAKRITRPEWIVHPWPATGTVRFAEECLLKETVRQYVLEVEGTDEIGYGGYGSTFAGGQRPRRQQARSSARGGQGPGR